MELLHGRARDTEGVAECFVLGAVDGGVVGAFDFTNATLMLLELFVTETVLAHAKSGSDRLSLAKSFLDFVTKGTGILLWRWEARRFTESKLLLARRVIDGRSFTNLMRHFTFISFFAGSQKSCKTTDTSLLRKTVFDD